MSNKVLMMVKFTMDLFLYNQMVLSRTDKNFLSYKDQRNLKLVILHLLPAQYEEPKNSVMQASTCWTSVNFCMVLQ